MKIENCIVPVNFHVLEMGSSSMPPFLGKYFLATAGEVVDMHKGNISFSNIDEDVFYKVVPAQRGIHLATYIMISDELLSVTVSQIY